MAKAKPFGELKPRRTGGAGVTPPGTRKQNLDRRFDQTQLRQSMHGTLVHRDYAAHFFRWGFASNFIAKDRSTRILDVGCGQDLPLIRVIIGNINALPSAYVGVDLNRLEKKYNIGWIESLYDEFSFVDRWKELKRTHAAFDLVTCFEVIEHMHEKDGYQLLAGVRNLMAPGATFLLSTPVYDGKKMAANHIHEYTVKELESTVKRAGFVIKQRFGTFASWNTLKKVITPEEKKLVETLNQYYSHDVLSCFLAPKYPDASRNNTWVLERLR